MTVLGRVFGVTGASGNLGAATVRALLAEGATVIALDRHAGPVRVAFESEIEAGKVRSYQVDLTNEESAASALRDAAKVVGRFDGIVCTVGGYEGGVETAQASWADWSAMLDVNVRTTVVCSRAALPLLYERGAGSIVHVASLASLEGTAGQAAYSAAKAAVLRFTEALAQESKSKRVRVNAVLPGTMDTPQNRAWMSPDQVATAIDTAAVADAILFLLSDASRAVTGAALKVTGWQ